MRCLLFLAICLSLGSCSYFRGKHIKCEGFDFRRLGFDETYFLEDLYYSNGVDTIKIISTKLNMSKYFECYQGNMCESCEPTFSFLQEDSAKRFRIITSFDYNADKKNVVLMTLQINLCKRKLMLDTINIHGKTVIDLGKKYERSTLDPYDEVIEKVEFEKYRITSIEKELGEVWRLIRVGDKVIDDRKK